MTRGLLLLLAGCGRLAFDTAPLDGRGAPLGPWNAPEQWTLTPGGDDPSLTGDLLELYYNNGSTDLYRTSRQSTTDAWPASSLIPELDVPETQSTPELTPDGLTLYFSSNRTGTLGVADIWMTTRATRMDVWATPVHVVELCSNRSDHPGNMTADGLTIVFDSHRIADTDDDLFMATRATSGDSWNPPVEVTSVNVAGANDESPFISPDGLELYFDSNRSGTALLYHSMRSSRVADFDPPEVIPIDTGGNPQADPWVSADGHDLVFWSTGHLWHSTR